MGVAINTTIYMAYYDYSLEIFRGQLLFMETSATI